MKHPGRWLWLLLLLPIAVGLARLRFNVEIFDLLPGNLPVVAGLKLYQQHFAGARELIVTAQASDPEQAENAARTIAESLRNETNIVATVTWLPPWLEHPDQAAELLAYLWLNQPPDKFNELADRLAPDKLKTTLDDARAELATSLSPEQIARLSYDPFGLTRLPESAGGSVPGFGKGQEMFSSSDGTFRIIFVKARTELRTYRDCEEWLTKIKQIVDQAVPVADRKASGVTLGYTGRPAFVAEIAGSMQHDITSSVGGTAVIIAGLFWMAHRRWKPMFWLLTLLALILASTLGLGGLIFGTINVVSMGFAAILLGLAVDYAVVHYQEALANPSLTIPQIRGAIAPSIFWAAVTTISAFLVLNFGGLPGLGQLGTLVGVGVGLSACIMIFEFLPPLFPERRGNGQVKPTSLVDRQSHLTDPKLENPLQESPVPIAPAVTSSRFAAVFATTSIVFIFACLVLMNRFPPMDPTANALRPRNSPAYTALDQIKLHLNEKREPLWLIIGSETEKEMARKLDDLQPILTRALSNNLIGSFTLPTPLSPRPEFQDKNRATARRLADERPILQAAALTNGFTETALGLSDRMLDTWQTAAGMTGGFWPTNQMSQWIFEKLLARTRTNYFVLGLLNPKGDQNPAKDPRFTVLENDLLRQGAWLSGWELLGNAIFSRVKANMWKVLAPMVSLVFISLLLAFRRPREVLLSVSVLLLSALCLLTVMGLAGWSWNLLNLMALPLVLGTGVDYSIFMQLALRRHHGDLQMAYRAVGRALLLCGGTAIAGFGSLAWSSNAGMASLGQVCAVGIASNMLISIYLLPVWWKAAPGARQLATGEKRSSL